MISMVVLIYILLFYFYPCIPTILKYLTAGLAFGTSMHTLLYNISINESADADKKKTLKMIILGQSV